jgi:hypothetical protein
MKKTVIKSGKLTLKKETLLNLSNDSLSQVQGGIVSIACSKGLVCTTTTGTTGGSTDHGNTHGGYDC